MVRRLGRPVLVGMWKHNDNLHLWTNNRNEIIDGRMSEALSRSQLIEEDRSISVQTENVHNQFGWSHQRTYDQHHALKALVLKGGDGVLMDK